MASKFYGAIGASGGSDGFLDNIDGTNLADADGTLVIESAQNRAGLYRMDVDKATAQAVPTIIAPDSNGGDKRWILSGVTATGLYIYEVDETYVSTILMSSGDLTIDNTYDGGLVTIMGENSGNSTILIGDPAGQLKLYYAGTLEGETVSGAFKATNALDIAGTVQVDAILDEDTLASDSATGLATQQSIKAYVDTKPDHCNVIINGNFDIWQRGISFPTTKIDYVADRWLWYSTVAEATITPSTDAPTFAQSGLISNYSMKTDITTADAAVAAADYALLQYKVEGYDMLPLYGNTMTLSFWVKSTITGTYSVGLVNNAGDRSLAAAYTINSSDTWEKKTITLTMDDADSYTWLQTNGIGLKLTFWLAAGSDYHSTGDDAWYSENKGASSSQVNGVSNTANNFLLSQLKLEKGSTATAMILRPYSQELALCQRYFQTAIFGAGGSHTAGQNLVCGVGLPVTMRADPTASNETDGVLYARSNCNATSTFYGRTSQLNVYRTATGTGNVQYSGSVELDIEL